MTVCGHPRYLAVISSSESADVNGELRKLRIRQPAAGSSDSELTTAEVAAAEHPSVQADEA